jgi:hypothetical protein
MAALSGFLGAGAAWAVAAAWQDLRNHHILSGRVAAIFHLPGPLGALAATGAVGGLMGALGGWTGYALREWLFPRAQAIEVPPFVDARKAAADAAGSESSDGIGSARAESHGRRAEASEPRTEDKTARAGDGDTTPPGDAADAPLAGPAGDAGP